MIFYVGEYAAFYAECGVNVGTFKHSPETDQLGEILFPNRPMLLGRIISRNISGQITRLFGNVYIVDLNH